MPDRRSKLSALMRGMVERTFPGKHALAAAEIESWITGTEVDLDKADWTKGAKLMMPGPLGGHNWMPMSYNPQTGLVYIPALDIPYAYGNEPAFEYQDGRWNIAINWQLNAPTGDAELDAVIAGTVRGHIAAWDPVAQKEVWRVQHAGSWNGGILSTAGNLIFQGTSHGQFAAYNAETGEQLWTTEAQTGVVAPPITYSIDGEQYITVVAGWGGVFGLAAGEAARSKAGKPSFRTAALIFVMFAKATARCWL